MSDDEAPTPEAKCLLCRWRTPGDIRSHVCNPCVIRLAETLTEVVRLHSGLSDALAPDRGAGEKVSGSREAPMPVRVDVIDLGLPAHVDSVVDWWQDQTGQISVATVLDSWVRDWIDVRAQREHLPTPTVPVLASWLEVRLDWARDHHPAIDDFAREIRELLGALRAITGHTGDHKTIGPCPAILDSGPCGATLTASPWIDIVECRRCGTRWERVKWLILGAAIQQRKAELSQPSGILA